MAVTLLSQLKGIDLSKEKLKDFKIVVSVQVFIIVAAMILPDLLKLFQVPNYKLIAETVFYAAIGIYVWSLYDMIRNYTRNKALLIVLFIFIMGVFTLSLFTVNPFFNLFEGKVFRVLVFLIMFCLLAVEASVIFYTIIEIAKRDLTINERIWGAACIYLIIGIAFGGVYEVISIVQPSIFQKGINLDTSHFMNSISFSFCVLGGIESQFAGTEKLIRHLSAIESVWGNLFIVFVVGRLMYK